MSLADTPPEADLGARLAAVLEVTDEGTAPARAPLTAALREHELLLVLDNCEHLPGLAPLVADMLAEAPGVRVLATSRTPLGVFGEHLLPQLGPQRGDQPRVLTKAVYDRVKERWLRRMPSLAPAEEQS